ncbi:thioredoxin family protein [candidate division KSB1 bacterium]|nr:thioredoxin family protein [candidate division KSB1 bacterium]
MLTGVLRTFAAGPEPGAVAPAFSLKNVDEKTVSLTDLAEAKAVVVVFTCNHCPFSQAYEPRLIQLQQDYADKGVKFILINPNDPKKQPEDSFEKMQKRATDKKYPFPYLYDSTQQIAKAYGANRTPEAYLLFPPEMTVQYRGRIDDNTEPGQVKKRDLKDALDLLLAGSPDQITTRVTKAFGCTIKWKE